MSARRLQFIPRRDLAWLVIPIVMACTFPVAVWQYFWSEKAWNEAEPWLQALAIFGVMPVLGLGFLWLWLRVALVGRCPECDEWMGRVARPDRSGRYLHRCENCGTVRDTGVRCSKRQGGSPLGEKMLDESSRERTGGDRARR